MVRIAAIWNARNTNRHQYTDHSPGRGFAHTDTVRNMFTHMPALAAAVPVGTGRRVRCGTHLSLNKFYDAWA